MLSLCRVCQSICLKYGLLDDSSALDDSEHCCDFSEESSTEELHAFTEHNDIQMMNQKFMAW